MPRGHPAYFQGLAEIPVQALSDNRESIPSDIPAQFVRCASPLPARSQLWHTELLRIGPWTRLDHELLFLRPAIAANRRNLPARKARRQAN